MNRVKGVPDNDLGAWVKTLDPKINTFQIGETISGNKLLTKVMLTMKERVKTKAEAQKLINYSNFTKLWEEKEDNIFNLQQLAKSLPDMSSSHAARQLEMLTKLFFLVTSSETLKYLQECERSASASELTEENVKLVKTIIKYCQTVDERDDQLKKYYLKHKAENGDGISAYEEMAQQIRATMQQASNCLKRILRNHDHTAAQVEEQTAQPSTPNVNVKALQKLLDKWTSLCNVDPAM